MEFLTQLWLPIVVASALVFVVSAVIHMATPLHKGDCRKVTNEEPLRAALRAQALAPGEYTVPRPDSMKDMGSPEMLAKYQEGPVVILTVLPNGVPSMGKSLGQWFALCLVVSAFAAYVGWIALGEAATYRSAFRITGTVAFAGYALGAVCESIWHGRRWSMTAKFLFDGLLYALATGGVFGWLWS
jgi:hypothetical protein